MNRSPFATAAARLGIFLLLAAVAVSASASPSNKWRIEFDGKSRVDGEIELSVTPKHGAATSLVVAIPARTGENEVARQVRDAFRQTFGDVYHAEIDDGEDVLVKAKGSTPDFEVVVVRNTVGGIRIDLERE